MGTKRDQRAQRKREKSKKKRDHARKTRGSRQAPVASVGTQRLAAAECVKWPVGLCFLSQNWHEQGPRVQACFTREHEDGRVAAVFCDVELEGRGVVEVLFRAPVSIDGVYAELATRSEELGQAIQVEDPARVAKLIHTGLELDSTSVDCASLRMLLGDLDPRACADEILTGTALPPPPRKKSLFTFLFGE